MTDSNQSSRNRVYFADAIAISFDLAEWHAASTEELLASLESAVKSKEPNRPTVVRLLGHLWGLVDAAHRLRELVQRAPGLKQRDPQVQLFLRRTSAVEGLRNYVQHLRSEIHSLPTLAPPVWGVVSWVSRRDPLTAFVLYTGSPHTESRVHSVSFDTWRGEYAQRLILSITGHTVDVADLSEAFGTIRPTIDKWSGSAIGTDHLRHFPVFPFRVTGFPGSPGAV